MKFQPKDKLANAKIALLMREPFWASLVYNLLFAEDKDGNITQTMATDGTRLYWYRPFVMALPDKQLVTVLAHEAAHCALLHMLRRGDRNIRKWNWAADHAVNLLLEEFNQAARNAGKCAPFEWPKTPYAPLMDKQFDGQCAEEIYSKLPTVADGGMGDVLDAAQDEAQKQHIESQWKVNLVQAAQAAKLQGKLPAEIERMVDALLNPPTTWREIMRRFFMAQARDDYSWTVPSRRYAHTGFILPSLHSRRLGKVGLILDSSGSIDPATFDAFMGHVSSIFHECRPEKVVLIVADAKVQSVEELDPTDELPSDYKGGGGTSFIEAIEKAEEHDCTCAIYFTDGYGTFPEVEPAMPVVWAMTTDHQAPFGEIIRIED